MVCDLNPQHLRQGSRGAGVGDLSLSLVIFNAGCNCRFMEFCICVTGEIFLFHSGGPFMQGGPKSSGCVVLWLVWSCVSSTRALLVLRERSESQSQTRAYVRTHAIRFKVVHAMAVGFHLISITGSKEPSSYPPTSFCYSLFHRGLLRRSCLCLDLKFKRRNLSKLLSVLDRVVNCGVS